jgi:hypothetical protein
MGLGSGIRKKTYPGSRIRVQGSKGTGPGSGTLPAIRVGIKKPTQKNPPKKTQKTHLKRPTKNGFFGVFLNL